jgi:AraC-like DNA-binding protein
MENSLKHSQINLNDFIVEYLGCNTSTSSKYEFLKSLQLAWPSLYEIEAISKKKFPNDSVLYGNFKQQTRAYKFDDDVAVVFGKHTSSAFGRSTDKMCGLVFPFRGKYEILQSETKVVAEANEQEGIFVSRAELTAYTSDIEAIAVAFNPRKLEKTMIHFAKNKNVQLPSNSRKIDFTDVRLNDLRISFFRSINSAGHFGTFEKATADMILRHAALIMLVSMGKELKHNSFACNAQVIDRLCARLYSNLSEMYTLSFMESFSGLSARVLQKEFNKRFGLSPFGWLYEQRLFRAKDLLSNPNVFKAVSEISRNCGFTHLGRFSVNFKSKFGVSASSFKKSF